MMTPEQFIRMRNKIARHIDGYYKNERGLSPIETHDAIDRARLRELKAFEEIADAAAKQFIRQRREEFAKSPMGKRMKKQIQKMRLKNG